ncbi:MAG TPA: LacI family DNA-binding transcriptional regulator [Bryobacteraceae bacterium]|nr:LacI family DNA-binding transcriptional regulator [Bryobacteraceae bacterium]
MSASIKDVARLAGVCHSTVSRALRNHGVVNAETADRIRRIAKEVGYRPNSIGRSLATRHTNTVGVVVTTVADPFVAEVVAGIEAVLHDEGYAVFLANSNAIPEREVSVVRSFHERRVDGVLVMASRVGSLYKPLLQELDVPIVLIDNQYPGGFAHSISIDDRGGARLAVRHLIGLGHRRIAYLGDQFGLQADADRLAGYHDELQAAGIAGSAELVVQGDGKPEKGRIAMGSLLALREPPTAVFCYNDMTAIGALRCLHAAGWSVPGRISVVGFDDLPIASFLEPPLTTVLQPRIEMGRRAARMLLDLLAGGRIEGSIRVPGELVVRGSTAPANRG